MVPALATFALILEVPEPALSVQLFGIDQVYVAP